MDDRERVDESYLGASPVRIVASGSATVNLTINIISGNREEGQERAREIIEGIRRAADGA